MMKLLIVLLNLAFSINAIAAEKVTLPDGRTGYFFEEDKGRKLLEIVDVDIPKYKQIIKLQERQIKTQKELLKLKDEKIKVQEDIAKKWKNNFEDISKRLSKMNDDEKFETYMDMGIFIMGTIVGSGLMYSSSLLVSNTIK